MHYAALVCQMHDCVSFVVTLLRRTLWQQMQSLIVLETLLRFDSTWCFVPTSSKNNMSAHRCKSTRLVLSSMLPVFASHCEDINENATCFVWSVLYQIERNIGNMSSCFYQQMLNYATAGMPMCSQWLFFVKTADGPFFLNWSYLFNLFNEWKWKIQLVMLHSSCQILFLNICK